MLWNKYLLIKVSGAGANSMSFYLFVAISERIQAFTPGFIFISSVVPVVGYLVSQVTVWL